MKKLIICIMAITTLAAVGCKGNQTTHPESEIEKKVAEYAEFTLTSDLVNNLTDNEKQLVKLFIEIGEVMDDIYWDEYFGNENRRSLDTITDPAVRAFAEIHYGAWDRLDAERPFIGGYGERPAGANFYPTDMTPEEYATLDDQQKMNQYSVIRRNAEGKLIELPYHEAYATELQKVDSLLEKAIGLADNPGMKAYLTARRQALRTDDYFESDMVWMDMKDSRLDFVVGPIENYDDQLNGLKCSHEAFVLVKDEEWSNRLAQFVSLLPEMQKLLPCEDKYKQETPGTECDLNVYDVIYYAGDCNAASKTIAINLPNDERVQLAKGSRRLQLKNAMKAKYDKILIPIADLMICPEQRNNITFPAFFGNTCYHEVAHGLGIKNTITSHIPCRKALGAQYSAWEEAKADVCGLFLTQQLIERGLITDCTVEQNITTFIAGLLRSVRFGATEAHGVANMMCYNYFQDHGVFSRDTEGKYVIDYDKAKEAMCGWAALIIKVEGDGDIDFATKYAAENGKVRPDLQKDLDAIRDANIPRDIRYNQGVAVLGL
ncbi:MAG: Zn-dependent hydrolase [Bacteroidales bacterium]|nr:Zn-dependent hydrolase [Bacteroidales bacterium]